MSNGQGEQARDWLDEEFKEYVEAFRTSSDRARYALYVVIVATVLIWIANYNLQKKGWALQRLTTWYSYDEPDTKQEPADLETQPTVNEESNSFPYFGGDYEQLKIAREEYLRQFVSSALVTRSPIPGVWIDFNDLGFVGGLSLAILMLVLVACIVREHENLHLALFKVRRLCSTEPNHENGDSAANLLYHGLAMRQVLTTPPTLARWHRGRALGLVWWFFFLPPVVHAWVVWTNWTTMGDAKGYGVNLVKLMVLQLILLLTISVLSVIAFLHARSMTHRWRRAFFRVNPGRAHAPQMTVREWLKLKTRDKNQTDEEVRVAAQLVDTLRARKDVVTETVELKVHHDLASSVISTVERDEMTRKICEEGTRRAKSTCESGGFEFVRLCRFEPSENCVQSDREGECKWAVAGAWTFRAISARSIVGVDPTEENDSGSA